MRLTGSTANPWQANTATLITSFTSNMQMLIDAIPLPPQLRDALTGTLWTARRSFFNLAPTLDEAVTLTGGLGTVTGKVSATDAEGDQILYRVVQGPRYGTVALNTDGTYTYTPTAGFDGVDRFVIGVSDTGLHVNLLEPFQGAVTASALVNQNAIGFEFTYEDPGNYFNDVARATLMDAAKRLAAYLLVDHRVVVTYFVNSYYDGQSGTLASASSNYSSGQPGFWPTVVGKKLMTGESTTGAQYDGQINWNWANPWGYGAFVPNDRYDMTSTAMHEMLHSFGWTPDFRQPSPTGKQYWTQYARYVVTRRGESPINSETLLWNDAYDAYLNGYDGGLFFSGPNAMAAYGGRPVPLYTPSPWVPGSSASHLDDSVFSGTNHLLMDSAAGGMGQGERTLSAIERGVLMDLGYTVIPNPAFPNPVFAIPVPSQLPNSAATLITA